MLRGGMQEILEPRSLKSREGVPASAARARRGDSGGSESLALLVGLIGWYGFSSSLHPDNQ